MDSFSSLISSPLIVQVVGYVVVFLLVVMIWWRLDSFYPLFERLWRLTAGNGDISDPRLREVFQRSHDVEKFRFIYGFEVSSIEECHTLLDWMDRYAINFTEARRASSWIDAKTANVFRPPSKLYLLWHGAAAAAVLLLICMVLALSVSGSALLKMKESETWFFAKRHMVMGVASQWLITAESCGDIQSLSLQTGFTSNEAVSLCKALEDDVLGDTVRSGIASQRWFSLIAWGLILVLAAQSSKLISISAAWKIERKLARIHT